MNYPVWDVAFGAGALMAWVAILHVFVSHFAVGSGLFLVLTERKARRENDMALLNWLKAHTKFFVLATVVFGAISGVGIWFTIGLISPVATSNLIHIYVWGWAIEWVFFFLEITAALLYLYGWETLDAKTHEWFGWVYFINAYMSLVIINGIITFMLTPGSWIKNHEFWSGFFNPTYFPSLALRTAIALALSGVYALITASVLKDKILKARIMRWAALWIVPSLLVVPLIGRWYIHSIPADIWESVKGLMPTGTRFALLGAVLLSVTLALALFALIAPKRIHLTFALLVALVALGTMGSFEMVRESIRKPYVIGSYLYANSLYANQMPGDGGFSADEINGAGILQSAKWIEHRELTPDNQAAIGREVFRVECESCHTATAYRGIASFLTLREWDQNKIQAMIGGIQFMHNGVMPAFAGTDAERGALAAYLSSLHPISATAVASIDGKTVFEQNCSMCHQDKADDFLFKNLPKDPAAANEALKSLPGLFPVMPDLKLSDPQRASLTQWVNSQRSSMETTGSTAQGRQLTMLQTTLIPAMDPNPLPAPFWLFKVLLIVTFFLHILAMNFMLGGGVLALTAKWRTKRTNGNSADGNPADGNRMFFDIARKLPSLLPATVTLGIAPLLFVQVLYGQYFYASSIVIAWPWFLVLVMLCAAYYSFYFASFQTGQNHRRASWAMLFSMILVLVIGFLYSNNMTLSEVPSRWSAKYFANPSGWNLNLTEPTLIPRFLHFMVAAVAMGGLLLVFMAAANWKRDRAYARQLLQFGARAFSYGTMAQLLVGFWFLASLPGEMRMLFMGANPLATILLLAGIVGGVASIFMMGNARRNENIRVATWYVPGITVVVILCMTWMRDILRDAYLKPYFHPEQFVIKTQWAVLPLFLALFIAGVVFWFVMLKRYGFFSGGKKTGPVIAVDSKAQ